MIAAGLLWYDDDAKRPLALKIADAAERYRQRLGFEPTTCQLSPALAAPPTPAPTARRKKVVGPPITLRLVPNDSLRPNYFFVGVEEGERLKRVPGWRDDDAYEGGAASTKSRGSARTRRAPAKLPAPPTTTPSVAPSERKKPARAGQSDAKPQPRQSAPEPVAPQQPAPIPAPIASREKAAKTATTSTQPQIAAKTATASVQAVKPSTTTKGAKAAKTATTSPTAAITSEDSTAPSPRRRTSRPAGRPGAASTASHPATPRKPTKLATAAVRDMPLPSTSGHQTRKTAKTATAPTAAPISEPVIAAPVASRRTQKAAKTATAAVEAPVKASAVTTAPASRKRTQSADAALRAQTAIPAAPAKTAKAAKTATPLSSEATAAQAAPARSQRRRASRTAGQEDARPARAANAFAGPTSRIAPGAEPAQHTLWGDLSAPPATAKQRQTSRRQESGAGDAEAPTVLANSSRRRKSA